MDLWTKLKSAFLKAAEPAPVMQTAPTIQLAVTVQPGPDDEPDYADLCERDYAPEETVILGTDDQGNPHCEDGAAKVVYHAGNDDVSQGRTEYHLLHGVLQATVEIESVQDEEGYSYRETWYDAEGKIHRDDGPAVTVRSNHHIPEETYLDESREEFWRHGEMVNMVDKTYEDIVSHKPLTVRQAFGYDV